MAQRALVCFPNPPCPPARTTPSLLSSLAFPLAAAPGCSPDVPLCQGKGMDWKAKSPWPVLPSQPRGANRERGSRSSLFPPSAVGPSSVPGGMLRSAHDAAAAAGVGCAGYQPCRTSEGLLGGGQGTSLLPGWGTKSPARSLSFLLTPLRSCWTGWGRPWRGIPSPRTLFDPSRKQLGGFEALLVPCCQTESSALSLRLFGAQYWAWRGQRVAMGGLMFLCQIKLS